MPLSSAEVLAVVEMLSSEEETVLRFVPRISKSDSNIFSEKQLTKKKALRDIDVARVLKSLQDARLVQAVKRKVWQTTPLGRKVAHEVMERWFRRRYDFPTIRR